MTAFPRKPFGQIVVIVLSRVRCKSTAMPKRFADLKDLPLQWEMIRGLRTATARGHPLMRSTVPTMISCAGTLKDCSENYDVLHAVLSVMASYGTVDTPNVDSMQEAVQTYCKEANYPDAAGIASLAHRDSWSIKRCLTALKRKWVRHEIPKDPGHACRQLKSCMSASRTVFIGKCSVGPIGSEASRAPCLVRRGCWEGAASLLFHMIQFEIYVL